MSLVRNITLLAVIGVLLLQWTNSIPLASVGGSLTIAMAFFAAALAVGIHEAWTRSRGVIGWIVNIVVSLVGAFVAAQIGGMTIVMILSRVANLDGSLAKTGGAAMSVALTGGMVATIVVAIRLDRWHARRYWRRKTQQGEAGVCLHSADGRRHVRVRPAERP